MNYGATEHVTGNPFAAAPPPQLPAIPFANQSNPFANPSMTMAAQPVQPYPTDSYMHGTSEQRDFNNQY